MVSMLAFYSNDPSSIHSEHTFYVRFVFEKDENKRKEAEVDH